MPARGFRLTHRGRRTAYTLIEVALVVAILVAVAAIVIVCVVSWDIDSVSVQHIITKMNTNIVTNWIK